MVVIFLAVYKLDGSIVRQQHFLLLEALRCKDKRSSWMDDCREIVVVVGGGVAAAC